jgi:hypothetical protein
MRATQEASMRILDERNARTGEPDDAGPVMPAAMAVSTLTRDFLDWVARQPRSYAETMDAWRTSCPRFPIWEDALDGGLVRVEQGDGTSVRRPQVALTPRGRALLDGVG